MINALFEMDVGLGDDDEEVERIRRVRTVQPRQDYIIPLYSFRYILSSMYFQCGDVLEAADGEECA
jgi:hypothetical protein